MTKEKDLINSQLKVYRHKTYHELKGLLRDKGHFTKVDHVASGNAQYTVETTVEWDDESQGSIRVTVFAEISPSKWWNVLRPSTGESFIIFPDRHNK